jgi:deazaflavin-dependent oxidoreductase (nitroreductase family)
VIEHARRRSGRAYRTPINGFPTADGYVFALTYGAADTDWVRNVQTAGAATLRTRARAIALTDPQVYVDRRYAGIRPPERWILPLTGADEFLRMTARR